MNHTLSLDLSRRNSFVPSLFSHIIMDFTGADGMSLGCHIVQIYYKPVNKDISCNLIVIYITFENWIIKA